MSNLGPEKTNETPDLLDHLFRHQWSQVVSHLTKILGPQNLELVEDSVQEALIKAMQVWPYQGKPKNPEGWILTVARNKAYDQLRRRQRLNRHNREIQDPQQTEAPTVALESELTDDVLQMMFACCHPSISQESQIILTLKILCGFGNSEIARALLKNDEAIAKAYTRAKKKLRDVNPYLAVPVGANLNHRLEVVLKIVYLLYNEGYNSSKGESTINRQLCLEAIRLGHILSENSSCNRPELHALLALMYLHLSRFETRLGVEDEIKTLAEQDRSQWDQDLINIGLKHLGISSTGLNISSYQLEAGIAACHCLAKDFDSTDWRSILALYDLLIQIEKNPIKQLNRIVAYGKVHGPDKAFKEMSKLQTEKSLNSYYLFYAIKGELLRELGHLDQARDLFAKAESLTENLAERKHLRKKQELVRGKKL